VAYLVIGLLLGFVRVMAWVFTGGLESMCKDCEIVFDVRHFPASMFIGLGIVLYIPGMAVFWPLTLGD
jgi:hypothetical protein